MVKNLYPFTLLASFRPCPPISIVTPLPRPSRSHRSSHPPHILYFHLRIYAYILYTYMPSGWFCPLSIFSHDSQVFISRPDLSLWIHSHPDAGIVFWPLCLCVHCFSAQSTIMSGKLLNLDFPQMPLSLAGWGTQSLYFLLYQHPGDLPFFTRSLQDYIVFYYWIITPFFLTVVINHRYNIYAQ